MTLLQLGVDLLHRLEAHADDDEDRGATEREVLVGADEDDAKPGFLLDGYPRTPDQVRYLDELLGSHGHKLDAVLRLVADQDEIVRRLQKRSVEQGRADDSEEAIRHRQEVYQRETAPVLELFREQGLLIEVDGLGTVDEVSDRDNVRGLVARATGVPALVAELTRLIDA